MIRPLYDRVVVRRDEEKEQTVGGLYIPGAAKEKPAEGTVLAVGQGRILDSGERLSLDVKVNDRIIFGKYAGNEVEIDNEKLVILREEEIMGVL